LLNIQQRPRYSSFLRAHPEESLACADEKRHLALRFSSSSFESRNAYAEAKSAFIEPIIERALGLGYPRAPASGARPDQPPPGGQIGSA
jgi:GrpB-like predicted nucleotidyltransferase (UPF0157 family)